MSSLAVKMRPSTFAEVIGQDAIVNILSKQIYNKAWKNSYLFAGPSGCGKTTMARIMSKVINNSDYPPIEIDAASNNGIDSIRGIIAEAQQTSVVVNYKIFVIDECQQLTKSAWDSALKLIEEPPSHSIFIFCTTNPSKIPDTILSRVQRFDFKKVDAEKISNHLKFILNTQFKEVEYDNCAIQTIAANSNGNVRLSVQNLEKCIDSQTKITCDLVNNLFSYISENTLREFTRAIIDRDLEKCVGVTNIIYNSGQSFQFLKQLISYMIDCILFNSCDGFRAVSYSKESLKTEEFDKKKFKKILNTLMKIREIASDETSELLLKTFIIDECGVEE